MNVTETNDLNDILDEWMIRQEGEVEHRPAKTIHASEITSCARMQVYDLLGFPHDMDSTRAHWIRSREVGNAIHEYYANLFEQSGILIENEKPLVQNEYNIGGRIDNRILYKGQEVIVDIKTVKQEDWKKAPKNDKFLEHYAQIQLYLHFLNMPIGLLYYVNRSDNGSKTFVVEYDAPLVAYLLERASFIKDCVDNKVIPEAEFSFKCNFCAFRPTCTMAGKDEYEL